MDLNQIIPVKVVDDFIITFEAEEEHIPVRQHFIKTCGWSESDYRKIKNYDWFSAKVSAWQNGVELGSAYLGCCSYKNASDFYLTSDDYFDQMVREAIDDARKKLVKVASTSSAKG